MNIIAIHFMKILKAKFKKIINYSEVKKNFNKYLIQIVEETNSIFQFHH